MPLRIEHGEVTSRFKSNVRKDKTNAHSQDECAALTSFVHDHNHNVDDEHIQEHKRFQLGTKAVNINSETQDNVTEARHSAANR